jgi:hypothetical protein
MRATGLVLLFLTAAGCATARPASREATDVPTETRREVGIVITEIDANVLAQDRARARRGAELRATSDTVRLRVGDVLPLETLPLVVIDSAGEPLGSLSTYDVQIGDGGSVTMTDAGIRGVRPGVGNVIFTVSRLFRDEHEGPAPSAVLHFVVRDR